MTAPIRAQPPASSHAVYRKHGKKRRQWTRAKKASQAACKLMG